MIKSELIARLAAKNPEYYQYEIENIVACIFSEISAALENGARVELRGFGTFSVKNRGNRIARNPRSGKELQIPARKMPHFRTGKKLRGLLNPK